MDRNSKAIMRMRTHISRLADFAYGRTFDDFCTDHMLYDATVLNVLQPGEQASKLDDAFCVRHNSIPWKDIKSVRNRIVHGYDDIDASVIWQIVTEDLPELAKQLENL